MGIEPRSFPFARYLTATPFGFSRSLRDLAPLAHLPLSDSIPTGNAQQALAICERHESGPDGN
ncbi:hypothetical protein [Halorhabdus rudnickae]|uniref:hypothetical protein n=1 Tax=Halorhabdus rudnickae TaxID=1775544 RepID=UPI0010844F35|nr:hypothetical protein [Halorhabdus rudnickae]